jgi:hypothetical protein
MVDHHTAGSDSLGYMLNRKGNYPFANALFNKNGTVHILSYLSVWGSGDGGPWAGVADEDSLHLVAWQNEVESLGRGQDFTSQQLDSLGRVNAALVWLGVPAAHEINHRDWADATNGVTGPLRVRENGRTTEGRKIDTLYDTVWLRQSTARFIRLNPPVEKPKPVIRPDGVVALKNLRPGKRNSDVAEFQTALRAFLGRAAASKLNPSGVTGFYGDETKALCRNAYAKLGWTRGDLTVPGPLMLTAIGLKLEGR